MVRPASSAGYRGAAGLNYFAEDRLVRAVLERDLEASLRSHTFERLRRFGALCGGKLARLIETAHQDPNLPRLAGNRVRYCREQLVARRLAMAALPPAPLLERMTMAYLLNQNGEGGVTCPLAMTDGLLTLLEEHGTPDQVKRWTALLKDAKGPTPLTAGQFVTERQGGSNVSENRTRAVRKADGTWRLTGLKWFCSNPGELWVTTAKPAGSDRVALFLVPKRRPGGGENGGVRLLKLKDISGTRGKATAEVEYRGAYAELPGPDRGTGPAHRGTGLPRPSPGLIGARRADGRGPRDALLKAGRCDRARMNQHG